jgi:hypothetical protein
MAVQQVVDFYEQLSPERVAQMAELYTEAAYFKDPFNEVHSLADIQAIFEHMYRTLAKPRFVITERIVQGTQCFLVWEFQFQFLNFRKGELQAVRGGSHLRFAPDGRVSYHRDYWDAAEELYEKLPVVGGLMRWMKRRANQ